VTATGNTDNASLQWLQQQRHVSHHQARWLNLLAAPSRVDPRWAFDGTTSIMLSGSCDCPISVQLWLEALKAELEGLFIDN
jgi:hypothetical protein